VTQTGIAASEIDVVVDVAQARLGCGICGPLYPNWTDRCTCECPALVHKAFEHEKKSIGPGQVCTGRNLIGRCNRCGTCNGFTPKETR
jgi:hypothetical protein